MTGLKPTDGEAEKDEENDVTDSSTTNGSGHPKNGTLQREFLSYFVAALESSGEGDLAVANHINEGKGELALIIRSNKPTTPPLLTLFQSLFVGVDKIIYAIRLNEGYTLH